MAEVFISYSRKDSKKVNEIVEFLKNNGIDVFIDKQLRHNFPAQLEQEIDSCKIFLLIGSKNAYQTEFVNKELTYAGTKNKEIVLYKIDDAEFSNGFGLLLSNILKHSSKETDKQELLTIIKKELDKPDKRGPDPGPDPIPKKHIITVLSAVIIIGLVMYCWWSIDQQKDKQQIVYELIKEHPDTIESVISTEQEVDLGLPIYWAGFNLGAEYPHERGDLYRWGTISSLLKSDESYTNSDDSIRATPQKDVVRKKWGDSWRIPSVSDFENLRQKCKIVRNVKYRNCPGSIYIGINGKCIFLPDYTDEGVHVHYSTNKASSKLIGNEQTCSIYSVCKEKMDIGFKDYGYAIRAVKDKK